MKTYIISSGQIGSGIVLNNGDAEYVLSGGTAVDTVVSAGGFDVVQGGGLALSTTVLAGGTEVVNAGGITRFSIISSGGTQVVSADGMARATSVGAGGTEYVLSGTTLSTLVEAGGFEVLDDDAVASGTTVQSGGVLVVLPGGSATATHLSGGRVQSGGVVLISGKDAVAASSGLVFSQVVNAGSVEFVLSGGQAVSAVLSGGAQEVFSGGTATGTVIRTGLETVLLGGTATGTVAISGSISVQSGGVAQGAVLRAGAEMFIASGGFARQTVVSAGASAFIFAGGATFSTTVDSGGRQFVDQGGVARDTVVASGGIEVVGPAGSAEVTQVRAGGEQYVSGGMAEGTVVSSGGVLLVASGQAADGTDIQSGGMLVVLPGGAATATIVEPGGQALSGGVFLLSGVRLVSAVAGVLSGVPVGLGEIEDVLSGGEAQSATVAGVQFVYSGGVAQASEVIGGGLLQIFSAGLATGAQVDSGGVLQVAQAGSATDVTVLAGGESLVLGGVADATVISSSGNQTVLAGAATATLVRAGGIENVEGGTTSFTMVQSGGTQYVQVGVTRDSVVSAGGYEVVSAGVALRTDVQSGGTLILLPGGSANNTTVASGGVVQSTGVVVLQAHQVVSAVGGTLGGFTLTLAETEYVLAQGVAAGGTDGGILNVASGGLASAVTVLSFAQVLSAGVARQDIVSGTQIVSSGGSGFRTKVQAGGQDQILSGGVESQAFVSAFGSQTVSAGGVAAFGTVQSGGVLDVQDGGLASGTELLLGGSMVLEEFGFVGSGAAFFVSATQQLVVSAGGLSDIFQLAGNYTGERFLLSGGFGITVTVATACYCRGTLILTDAGEAAVEDMRIGDRVMTRDGTAKALRWIGNRSYSGRFAAGNRDVLPVGFRAGCLGEGLPRRDLWVSPLHAMYLDGVLIPAMQLVNGAGIVQAESVAQVEYFHLELAAHDVIFAEGAASESYVDDDNRAMFHNAASYAASYPGAGPQPAVYCAPRVESGAVLEAVRRRLGGAAPLPSRGALLGWLDAASRGRVAGWALDTAGAPALRILDNGVAIGEVAPCLYRDDVRGVYGGDGLCGFDFVIEGGLSPLHAHEIRLERVLDGAELPHSPWLIPAGAEAPTAGPLRGQVDRADRHGVLGWAEAGEAPVGLVVLDNGVAAGHVLANLWRADVANAGVGDGRHAFAFTFPGGLLPSVRHVIEVRREADGAMLLGAPVVIPPAGSFDTALEQAVTQAVAAVSGTERQRALSFMLAQTETLLQASADAQGRRDARQDWDRFRRHLGEAAVLVADPGLRALVIDAAPPRPEQNAGGQALLSHMRALQSLGHEVSFVAAGEMQPDAALQAAGMRVCALPFYASVEDVLRRQSECFDVVYLHRAAIADAYLALARHWQPKARILYAVADLHHLRLARAAVVEQRADLQRQSVRLHLAECGAAVLADAVITHSPAEAELLGREVPRANIHVVPWEVVPRPSGVAFAKRRGVGFIGHYGHAPNVDAARFLVEQVMPLVWREDGSIGCVLAGSAMPEVVRRLAGAGIEVLGEVSQPAELYDRVRLTVAPLRYGAGIKGKVLESFAYGVACAMSPIAAEGLDLPAALLNCVAADAVGIAGVILRLHRVAGANKAAARAGLALIGRQNTAACVRAGLEMALTPQVVSRAAQPVAACPAR